MSAETNRILPLPKASSNEDLETHSRNQFALLFEPALFEIRPEVSRDKGIDLTIEMKEDGSYTNFRSAFQLKSTDTTKPNKDGTMSYSVDVSNIQYLLNFVMPAYYILFDKSSSTFFIENANKVYADLIRKYQDQPLPETFSIKFSRKLTPSAVTEIYAHTLANGKLLSRIGPKMGIPEQGPHREPGIVIDSRMQVYSVQENIDLIHKFGFDLLNNHEFTTIIEIEKRSHPRGAVTPDFNLVCGIAYYQRANVFKAIEFLKMAEKDLDTFAPEIGSMLRYTLLHARYILGIITEEVLNEEIEKITSSKEIGSFLKLEKLKKEYWNSEKKDKERLQWFYSQTDKVISEEIYHNSLYIVGYAQLLSAESIILINDAIKNFMMICGRVKDYRTTRTFKHWERLETAFLKRLDLTVKFAYETKDLLGLTNLGGEKTGWLYNKTSFKYILENFDIDTLTVKGSINHSEKALLITIIPKLERQAEGYEILGHIENKISCLSRKYEVERLAELNDEASATAELIAKLIADQEYNGLKDNFDSLINGNTGHERMIKLFTDRVNDIYKIAKNSELGEYFKMKLNKAALESVEENIKWSVDFPMAFRFPKVK